MNKILLIVQREYLTRVRKKSFLLTTFLVPIMFIGMYTGVIFLTKKSFENTHAVVYIIDEQGDIANQLHSNKNVTYVNSSNGKEAQIADLRNEKENTSLLLIPQDFLAKRNVEFLSVSKPNLSIQNEIRSQLSDVIRRHQYLEMGISMERINSVDSNVQIIAKEITEEGDTQDSNTEVAMGIAFGLSILVYVSLFLYGSQVMRGIIEEKSNRIIEVIISSVRPFQLMMGKIVGIGLVGLTQFVLWLLLSAILVGVASAVLMGDSSFAKELMAADPRSQSLGVQPTSHILHDVQHIFQAINFGQLISCFFIFFLGGYLIYSALFAAVGSAVDSETEASQFTMPITMPLLLTYVLSFGVLTNDPHGPIATWLSFIPFTSPIAMLVRIPFGVPMWQIVVSALLLVGGFVLTTWVASRIYRVGILMHGKKASFKELIKWFKYKN